MDRDATQPTLPAYPSPGSAGVPLPPGRPKRPIWLVVTLSVAGVLLFCCVGSVIFAESPLGQQIIAQSNATATAQALAAAYAHATATENALLHPTPTTRPVPTSTIVPPTRVPATATPRPTATPQAIYPPKTKADLDALAVRGDASAVNVFDSENTGLVGVCPEPRREVTIDPSITGKQLAEDLLAYFYGESLDSPCSSLVLAFHSQSEAGGAYTVGRINLDVADASGGPNIDPNGTNLTYTLTLDIGNALSPQEYIVTYQQ